MKMNYSYGYTENEDQPKYLNKVLGDRNAARIVADIYQGHIEDGTFWDVADDVVAQKCDGSIDHEVAKKMVRHHARIFADVD